MKRLFLIHGDSGAGKSHLARCLEVEHSFKPISLDDEYVEFVRSKCPMLYLDALGKYVGPHYQHLLARRDYSKAQFGRDFVAEWQSHVRSRVQSLLATHDELVVEGWLLKHLKRELQDRLRSAAKVYQIEARNKCYFVAGRILTIAQISALGTKQEPEG
jgi:hypothetical protein